MTPIEKTLENYQIILAKLTDFFKNELKAARWMQTENPLLGNVTPISMILAGREARLLKFINHAFYENGDTHDRTEK